LSDNPHRPLPAELRIGDSPRRKIDEAIAHSRFGVVVLSPSFFAKGGPSCTGSPPPTSRGTARASPTRAMAPGRPLAARV
jgi:hypothetical protein